MVLGRSLTTLDVVSGGRLRVGLGLGYSDDEYEAAGTSAKVRGRRADEFLDLLKRIWTTDPVEYSGEFFTLAPSVIGLKPVQEPHPPIYLAAYVPAALRRAARFTNGWMPSGLPIAELRSWITDLRQYADDAGRDPSTLEIIIVCEPDITPVPMGADRGPLVGSEEQIEEDITALRQLGVDELIFELRLDRTPGELRDSMTQLRALVR